MIVKHMLDHSTRRYDREAALDRVFHALAHRTRRDILRRVIDRDRSISELAARHDMTLEAVSQHVRVLERAALIRRVRKGREQRCRLDPAALAPATTLLALLARDWEERVDALEEWLAANTDKEAR
jgi:DNA-binding transcriptional ArsR family regulator